MGRSGCGTAPFYLGIQIGMVLVMIISASSAAVSVLALPGVRPVVVIVAILYFRYLAYRSVAPPPLIAGILLSLADPNANASTAALFWGSS